MFYMLIFKRHKNEFAFSVISWHSHVTGRQKPFSRKTMTHVPYIANTTANDCMNNHGTCFDIPEYSGLDTSTFYRWQRPDDSRTETMHLEVPWNKYMLTTRKAPFMGKACIYTKIILLNRVSKVMFDCEQALPWRCSDTYVMRTVTSYLKHINSSFPLLNSHSHKRPAIFRDTYFFIWISFVSSTFEKARKTHICLQLVWTSYGASIERFGVKWHRNIESKL